MLARHGIFLLEVKDTLRRSATLVKFKCLHQDLHTSFWTCKTGQKSCLSRLTRPLQNMILKIKFYLWRYKVIKNEDTTQQKVKGEGSK